MTIALFELRRRRTLVEPGPPKEVTKARAFGWKLRNRQAVVLPADGFHRR